MDSQKLLKDLSKLQKSLWEVNLTEFPNLAHSVANARSAFTELENLLRKDQAAAKRKMFGQKVVQGSDVPAAGAKRNVFGNGFKAAKKPKSRTINKETPTAEDEDCAVSELLQKIASLKPRTLPWAAKVLGIAVTADAEQANLAFRSRAKLLHPDVSQHPKASEVFQSLQWALEDFIRYESKRN
jgi:hypothetical protein